MNRELSGRKLGKRPTTLVIVVLGTIYAVQRSWDVSGRKENRQ